jgi:hypothetical protein
MRLKAGDVADVYHDPITRQKREGTVILFADSGMRNDELEFWSIHFIDDPPGVYTGRWINPEDRRRSPRHRRRH